MEQEVKEFESLAEVLEHMPTPTDVASGYRRYIERKAREKGVPISGIFELTPLCNLDCKMCYVHLTSEQMGNKTPLSVEQWKSLMKEAVDHGMMYATLTGGECLLYPGFDEVYLYLQSLGVRVALITNGLLLTSERIRFFQTHPPISIQVSFYGASESGYENVTGHQVFALVKNNTLKAKAAGLPIKAGITSSHFMGREDEALIDLLIKMQIPFTINSTLFPARPETGRTLQAFDQSVDDYIRLRKAYMERRGAVLPIPCEESIQQIIPAMGIQCGAGTSGFSIDWRGRMYACTMLPDIVALPLEEGFTAAWKSIHDAAIKYPNPQECAKCQYQTICPQCVAAHRKGALPGHANPSICALTKALIAEISKER